MNVITEQDRDELLARLTPKQRAFVLAYVENNGNATQAAEIAGYYNPSTEGCLNIRKPKVRAAIEAFPAAQQNRGKIATAEERQMFWTAVMKGEIKDRAIGADGEPVEAPARLADRLKGSELLGRAQTDFVERKEHTLTIIQEIRTLKDEELEERIRRLESD